MVKVVAAAAAATIMKTTSQLRKRQRQHHQRQHQRLLTVLCAVLIRSVRQQCARGTAAAIHSQRLQVLLVLVRMIFLMMMIMNLH